MGTRLKSRRTPAPQKWTPPWTHSKNPKTINPKMLQKLREPRPQNRTKLSSPNRRQPPSQRNRQIRKRQQRRRKHLLPRRKKKRGMKRLKPKHQKLRQSKSRSHRQRNQRLKRNRMIKQRKLTTNQKIQTSLGKPTDRSPFLQLDIF